MMEVWILHYYNIDCIMTHVNRSAGVSGIHHVDNVPFSQNKVCMENTFFFILVLLHYIGAGRRGTGDWCFEDGFITFRDIAQLYLRASHNFKGRVLAIVSDCSYSGCWVRECMEFLDEQGV